jgi:uncharacterized protein (TIRG00374 family)
LSTQSKFFSIIKYLLLLAIGLFLLWLTFRNENLDEVFRKIRNANFFFVFLSVILGFISFIIRAQRWNMMLVPLGFKPKLTNACYALGIGYFANLAIPRIGEITRCGVLSKAENVPFEKLIGTVIIERVIDLFMLAFSILFAAVFEYNLLTGFLNEKIISPIKEKASSGSNNMLWILIAAVVALISFSVFIYKSKRMQNLRNKIKTLYIGVLEGLKSIFKMKKPGLFIFYTFLMWFLYFLAVYICFFAFEPTSHLGMKEGLFVLVAGGLGMSAPVQGGIGAYHYIVSQSLMLFNISSTDGIVYATIVHTSQTLLVIIIGLISLIMIFRQNKERKERKA